MLDHHALGAARRARRIDDVTEIGLGAAHLGVSQPRGALGFEPLVIGVHAHDRRAGITERAGVRTRRDDRVHGGVLENEAESLERALGIDRDVGRARLEDAEQGRVSLRRAGQQQRDTGAPGHAAGLQVAGDPVRVALERLVRDAQWPEGDCDGVRIPIGPGLEDLVQQCSGRSGRGPTVAPVTGLGRLRRSRLRFRESTIGQ
jgi:hypothetical protein